MGTTNLDALTISGALAAGSAAITGAASVGGAATVAGALTVSGAAALNGGLAVTGQVAPSAGVIVGEADSASNEYDFFYADGTNRPKLNSWQAYDYGTGAFRTCYVHNGSLKIA